MINKRAFKCCAFLTRRKTILEIISQRAAVSEIVDLHFCPISLPITLMLFEYLFVLSRLTNRLRDFDLFN